MKAVSKETDGLFSNKPNYSDEIDKLGDEVDIHFIYLMYNINLIYNELK